MARRGGGWFAALHLVFSLLTAVPIYVRDVGTDVCIPCCWLPKTCLLAPGTICGGLSECVIRYTVSAAKTLQLLPGDVSSADLTDRIIFLFLTSIMQLV